jgi:hypothetical protein
LFVRLTCLPCLQYKKHSMLVYIKIKTYYLWLCSLNQINQDYINFIISKYPVPLFWMTIEVGCKIRSKWRSEKKSSLILVEVCDCDPNRWKWIYIND